MRRALGWVVAVSLVSSSVTRAEDRKLVIAGAITLAAGYTVSAAYGLAPRSGLYAGPYNLLNLVPVVGPVLRLGVLASQTRVCNDPLGCGGGPTSYAIPAGEIALTVLFTAAQVTGLTLLIIGLVKKTPPVTPVVVPGGGGLMLTLDY